MYGLKRPTWWSLSSKHFDDSISDHISTNTEWEENGLIHLKQYFDLGIVDRINNEIEQGLQAKRIDFNYTNRKIVFAYKQIPLLKEIINHSALKTTLEQLIGGEVIPFQSINFIYGSEQKAHSDSVHMSTYPAGGLIAIWVALDDIDDDNGPLFYYPGSHKLPYATNKLIGNSEGNLFSRNPNANYETYVAQEIEKHNLSKQVLSAKKGDVIVWHANLLHGGMPHTNKEKTRRSMVVHYFQKNRICYHELSQRPAIINPI